MKTPKLLQCLSRIVLTLVFMLSMGISSAFAVDIYVSSTNGSDAFDGSQATVGANNAGPKQTIAAALGIAAAGDRIIIEAGAYGTGAVLNINVAVTMEVTPAGAVTAATYNGAVTIAANVTFDTGPETFNPNGNLTVNGGTTLTLGAGDLVLATNAVVTMVGAANTGAAGSSNVAGNAPAFGANTFVTYTAGGTAGLELPANLRVGTVAINGGVSMTFPNAFTVNNPGAGNDIVWGAGVPTTFNGAVTVDDLVVTNPAQTTTFTGLLTTTGGNATHAVGAGNLTIDNAELGGFNLVQANAGGVGAPVLTSTGTVSFTANGPANDDAINNGAGGNMTLTNVAFVGVGGPGVTNITRDINNTGTLNISGTITSTSAASTTVVGVHDIDVDIDNTGALTVGGVATVEYIINNGAPSTATFNGATTVNTFVTNAGAGTTLAFNANSTVNGNVNNTATMNLGGATTLTLTSDAAFTQLGTINGATSTVNVTGDGAFTGVVDVGGNMILAGVAGAGNNFNFVPVAPAPGNDIDGKLTVNWITNINGPVIAGSIDNGATGTINIPAGQTLTCEGNFDDSLGGAFNAATGTSTLAFALTGDGTYTPGPNRLIDNLTVAGANRTLTIAQSVAVNVLFNVGANATVNLTDRLVRMVAAAGTVNVAGTGLLTANNVSGALSFENVNQTITGLGTFTNIVINNAVGAAAGAALTLGAAINVSGFLNLFNGFAVGHALDLNGNNLNMVAPNGTIGRRMGTGAPPVTTNTLIVDLLGVAGVIGNWNLNHYGPVPAAAPANNTGLEYAVAGVNNWDIATTTNPLIVVAAAASTITGNVTVRDNANALFPAFLTTINGALTVEGEQSTPAVAPIGGLISDAGVGFAASFTLNGANQAHTVAGQVTALGPFTVSGNNATLTGSATIGANIAELNNLIVEGVGVVVTALQQINGVLTVGAANTLATLSIGMTQDTTPSTDAENGTVTGLITANGAGVTLTSNIASTLAASPAVAHNRGPVNLGAFNLLLNGAGGGYVIPATNPNGASFTAGVGALVANAVNNIIDLQSTDIPNLTSNVALATLLSNLTVSTMLDINANMGGAVGTEVLTLSGDAQFNNGNVFGPGTINAVGTDFTLIGAVAGAATINNLTINSPNPPTTNFISGGGGADNWLITGNYNQIAGDVNLNGNDLFLTGPGTFTYTAGSYSMTGDGEIVFNGMLLNTSNVELIIPHLDVNVNTLINDDDILTIPIGGTLDIDGGTLQIENAPAAGNGNGTLNLGDGCTINGNGGFIGNSLVAPPGSPVVNPNYGVDINNIYNVAYAPTTMELAPDIGLLQINAPVTFAALETPTVNALDLNAALTMSFGVGGSSVTIDDGGTVNVSTNVGSIGAFGGPAGSAWAPAGGPLGTTLTFDATGAGPVAAVPPTLTTNGVWPAAAPITQLNVNFSTGLHANRTAQNAAVNAPYALGGNVMTFTGNVVMGAAGTFNAQNGVASAVGTVSTMQLGGTTPQTFTVPAGGFVFQVGTDGNADGDYVDVGDVAPTAFTLNNAAGATLAGGNVTMANTGGTAPVAGQEALANFNAGVLQTGVFVFTIAHYNTLNQGHTQGATGGIYGFARKEIVVQFNFGASPANRKAFPMATLAGSMRDMALTFDDPSQIAPAGARSGIFITVQYNAATVPDGNNNMPLDTINGAPLVDRNGLPLTVARYSPDGWNVILSVALSPAVDYDWEGHMAGYADYVNEEIERTVGLRQEFEINPPGVESDNFWFPLGQGSDHTNFQANPDDPTVRVVDAQGALIAAPGTKFAFGLESNMAVLDPCPQCTVNMNNGQPPVVIDLTAIVTGGTPANTYTVTNNDAAIATGAEAGGNLTVTSVAPGSTTIDVLVTDRLNDSRTVTITINVSDALATAAVTPDPVVLAAAAPGNTWDLDLTTVVTGGAAPYVYGAPATTDGAVAGGVMAGSVLTVTSAGAGAAVITVNVNDANGSAVVVTVNVTVNTALGVDAAIADFTQQVGAAPWTTDLSAVFGGGTGTIDYTAVSADEVAVTVEITGTTLSVTALTADMDGTPVTVTVTVTDDFGSINDAFDVTRQPLWGDGSVNGEVTAFDATYALQEASGLITVQAVPLTAMQILVLDVTGNGAVTAFDGAHILQFSAGLRTCFLVEAGCPAKNDVFATGQMGWGEASVDATTKIVSLPVNVTGDVNDVYSMQFVSQVDLESVNFKAVTANLPEDWQVVHSMTDEGVLSVAMMGTTPINDPGEYVNLTFELLDETAQPTFTADGMVNENAMVSFGEVTAREIPTEFALHGNYPNPFNPTTNIKYSLPEASHVVLEVFDVTGRLIQSLVDGEVDAGHHMVRWDARNAVGVQVASGLYIYRIHAADFVDVKTMLLVK